MRRALEVAWLSAYRVARQPPAFAGLDDVVFKNQAREPKKEAKRFINDTVWNDFHRKFLFKYIK